ncbi:unnamed protein product [Trichobilharzia szidati]|nr:unnamed protein product [Trichobilharzia szidati]
MGCFREHCKDRSLPINLFWFARQLVRWKYVVAVLSLVFILSTSIICIIFFQMPDFNNPFVDFVTIGTSWSARTQQYLLLLAETSNNPDHFVHNELIWFRRRKEKNEIHEDFIDRSRRFADTEYFEEQFCLKDKSIASDNSLWNLYAKYSRIVFSINYDTLLKLPNQSSSQFKLNDSKKNVTFLNDTSLWYTILSDLCKLQRRLTDLSTYKQLCYTKTTHHNNDKDNKYLSTKYKDNCCSVWSLSNMIASMFGKRSCKQLTFTDAQRAAELITACYPTFLSGQLRRSCWDNYDTDPALLCPMVQPSQCLHSPLLPIILAALLPDDNSSNRNVKKLEKTLMVIPIHATGSHLFFDEIENEHQSGRLTSSLQNSFHIHSIYINEYDEIVNRLLFHDTSWLLISVISLVLLLTIWTGTLFIPLITVMAIIWSLLIAYSIYTMVLQIPHFSIINLMAIVLVTGLSADDLLVFYQVWKHKRSLVEKMISSSHSDDKRYNLISSHENHQLTLYNQDELNLSTSINTNHIISTNMCLCDNGIHLASNDHTENVTLNTEHLLAECLHFTLLHAIPSMTLTTISTLSGLLVNLLSSIVAIQRFTIFASLVITCNYIFVFVVVTPMVVILAESKCSLSLLHHCIPLYISKAYQGVLKKCHQLAFLFNKLIIDLHFLSPIIIIASLSFTSYQLLWLRKFDIPHDYDSTFLRPNHPLELFTRHDVSQFWTERHLHQYQNLLKINFVWGPQRHTTDNRTVLKYNHDNVHSGVKLLLDSTMNFTSTDSRLWFSSFCNELKRMPYLFQSLPTNFRQYSLNSFQLYHLNPLVALPVWCPFGRYINSLDNYILSRDCKSIIKRSACCMNHRTPILLYNSSVTTFIHCLYEYASHEGEQYQHRHLSGFRFMPKRGVDFSEPVGFTVSALTNIALISASHTHIQQAIENITIWFNNLLANAPQSLHHGFIAIPELEKFEIITNITQYVYQSIIIAVCIASLLILVISRNIILSLLSLICLTSCLMLCLTILSCLDNWALGMIEGLVISLAAGLAIDPCIHLAYAICKNNTRNTQKGCKQSICSRSVLLSVLTSLGSAITGSAWTSAITGIPMIFSSLLCYHQIGAFLTTLMFCSWLFCYIILSGILAFIDWIVTYYQSV